MWWKENFFLSAKLAMFFFLQPFHYSLYINFVKQEKKVLIWSRIQNLKHNMNRKVDFCG